MSQLRAKFTAPKCTCVVSKGTTLSEEEQEAIRAKLATPRKARSTPTHQAQVAAAVVRVLLPRVFCRPR